MNTHSQYPDVLVETSQVDLLLARQDVRLVEVDLDPSAYAEGHIQNALLWNWEEELRDPETHQIPSKKQIEDLLRKSGISNSDTVLLYGDHNNWFACWAFWLLKLYGHDQVFLIDGGTRKWFAEGRKVSSLRPTVAPSQYVVKDADTTNQAGVEDIFMSFFDPDKTLLVDVRSDYEYDGRSLGPVGVTANCAVAGHIPTAINIPWTLNCRPDGTFKPVEELTALYESFGMSRERKVITYCAIGERASLSWFVIKYLLKHPTVLNYDRSMAEWSRIPNAPIVTGEAA